MAALPAQAAPSQPTTLMAQLARPTKVGPVTGLTATATKPTENYRLSAVWNVLTGATSYNVTVTDSAGMAVAQGKVSQPSATETKVAWSWQTSLPALTRLTVKVVPLAGKRPGRAATTQTTLPDLTAPVGSYTLSLDETGRATFHQESLSDDVTPVEKIQRWIDWGMGNGWEAWTTGVSISHDYPELGLWKPRVRLLDNAGNERVVTLQTVVTGDYSAPSGTYTTTPQRAWAQLTRVVLTETALSDNLSAREDIVRWVDWRDGTTPTQWTRGTTLTHVYQAGGTFSPSVRLVDEAGNAVTVDAPTVTVAVDAAAPTVRITVPKRKAAFVDSWRTLRGTARDPLGTGVRQVQVRVVEKRGATWYAYQAPGKRWVKAGSTKAAAMKKTRPGVGTLKSGRWSMSVARLRKGTIVVKATATDRVGNVSKPAMVSQRLTR
ncbi:MAG TPA: hypothetical protein VK964_14785 [Nocardioidaceae bacterium]|nr:hypothetical protein [Nocardioidaceae bacterium]